MDRTTTRISGKVYLGATSEQALERLCDYEDAEEQKRLVIFPYAVGEIEECPGRGGRECVLRNLEGS